MARGYHDTRRASPTYVVIQISDANGRVRIVYIYTDSRNDTSEVIKMCSFHDKKKKKKRERLPT